MDLVINDQAPVESIQESKVSKLTTALGGQDLVGRNGDRLNLFCCARVLPDFIRGQRGALQELITPLACRDRVGDQDQGVGLRCCHSTRTDQRLSCTTGKHNHTRATLKEVGDSLLLVVAQCPAIGGEVNVMVCTGLVTGIVFSRPAELEQLLLELSSCPGSYFVTTILTLALEQGGDLLRAGHFRQNSSVSAFENERAFGITLNGQATIAIDGLRDVDGHTGRNGILRIFLERAQNLFCGVTSSTSIPEP